MHFKLFRLCVWKCFCIVSYQFATWEQKGGNEVLLSQSATRTHDFIFTLKGYIHKCWWFCFWNSEEIRERCYEFWASGFCFELSYISKSHYVQVYRAKEEQMIRQSSQNESLCFPSSSHCFWNYCRVQLQFYLNTSGFSCSLFRKKINKDSVHIVVGRQQLILHKAATTLQILLLFPTHFHQRPTFQRDKGFNSRKRWEDGTFQFLFGFYKCLS